MARLKVDAFELLASCSDAPEEALEILTERVALLEGLLRDFNNDGDRMQLARAYLQAGDVFLTLAEMQNTIGHEIAGAEVSVD